ncbi:neurabin-1-like isoform X7 [Babesia caballi]|uniref:Neurabin-1-like isoform X7 n=1 Tax=Babesia caballi TaxID=5871 RepID=A0AAV4LNS4_BABCB|nr:neurabin-1-like isoform X7 [Babesia caballi]
MTEAREHRRKSIRDSLRSMRETVMGSPPVDGPLLVNELRNAEKVDRHWELAFRRRYLVSKEDEWHLMARSFRFSVTQWDLNALLCGAFIMQCVYGLLCFSPLSVVISIFAFCYMIQLRTHRDKLTLYFGLTTFGAYIILMVNLLIVQPEHRVSYGWVTAVFGASFVHLIILATLGRYTAGRRFERFAEACLQFRVPSMLEVLSLVTGVTAFLGAVFATVRLYCLAYTAFVVVFFVVFGRMRFADPAKLADRRDSEEENPRRNFMEACLPVVRCLISVMFSASAVCVCVASLVPGHVLTLRNQEAFRVWESKNALRDEYVFTCECLAYLLTVACAIVLAIQCMVLLQLLLHSHALRRALEHSSLFMGKACMGRKGNINYVYHHYSLDRAGRVTDVGVLRRTPLPDLDRSCLTAYDVYLAMQRRALVALEQRSLYCYVPVAQLYSAERDSSALVRCRVGVERMARELDLLVAQERARRHAERKERERLRRLEEAMRNRPDFVSTSIPVGVGIAVPPTLHDSFREAAAEATTRNRSMSIPVDLSLCNVDEIPAVERARERLYQRRCVTTAVGEDFHWRRRGIIDRVRCSWLQHPSGDTPPSFELLRPATARVNRDPNRGDFNFDKIDMTLSTIFSGLEIMNNDAKAPGFLPPDLDLPLYERPDLVQPKPWAAPDAGLVTPVDTSHVTIDLGDPSPLALPPKAAPRYVTRIDIGETPSFDGDLEMGFGTLSPDRVSVAKDMPQPAVYIDLGSSKSTKSAIENGSPEGTTAGTTSGATGRWRWLDNAMNSTLPVEAQPRPELPDEMQYERIRPLEEALEGQYYINEQGKLVVKCGNRFVPVRFHGKRNVRNLAQFFDGGRQQAGTPGAILISSDSDSDSSEEQSVPQVVDSPSHRLMIRAVSVEAPPVPALGKKGVPRIIMSDSTDGDATDGESGLSSYSETVSFNDDHPASLFSKVVVTREYETLSPYSLSKVSPGAMPSVQLAQFGESPRGGQRGGETGAPAGSGTDEGHSKAKAGEPILAISSGGTAMSRCEASAGNAADLADGATALSPWTLRRLSAVRHLPLALDSRHDKVFCVRPQPRANGEVLPPVADRGTGLVDSVPPTPSSAQPRKVAGCSGGDVDSGYPDAALDFASSPQSSLATLSPSGSSPRPVVPRRAWRSEFDFSPVVVHTAEDVLRELLADVDILDSGAEEQGSDVSHDFIFGR